MKVRTLLIILFFATTSCVVLTPLTQCNQPKIASYHRFLQTEEFKNLSREKQLEKCGSCHKQEYENELKGPHSHAYESLVSHRAFVNSDKYDCALYTRRVNTHLEECARCHSPQNLPETIFKNSKNMDTLTEKTIEHPLPLARASTSSRLTGIDCFSCHYDGTDLVSSFMSKNDNSAKDLSQSRHITVRNNLLCYSCHLDIFDNINPSIAIKQTGAMLCVNCHQEYGKSGKGTHYYYWKKDSTEKISPKWHTLLDDFHITLSSDKKKMNVVWENTNMPHTLPIATEMFFKFDALDEASKILETKSIRVNRKKEWDINMYEQLENQYLGGIVGNDVPLSGNKKDYAFELTNSAKAEAVRISYIYKAQFWFPDSLGKVKLTKVYPIEAAQTP